MIELVLGKRYVYVYFIAANKQKEIQFYFSFISFNFDFSIIDYMGDMINLYNSKDIVRKIYHD